MTRVPRNVLTITRPLPLATGAFTPFLCLFLSSCLPQSFFLSGGRGVLFPKGALTFSTVLAERGVTLSRERGVGLSGGRGVWLLLPTRGVVGVVMILSSST